MSGARTGSARGVLELAEWHPRGAGGPAPGQEARAPALPFGLQTGSPAAARVLNTEEEAQFGSARAAMAHI